MKFPKKVRILKREDYLKFFHQADVKKLRDCIIFRVPNQHNHARLGITVKSKTTSVFRNRIKRQIREHFRLNQTHFKPADYNIVIPSYVKVNFKTGRVVRESLQKLIHP